MEKSASVRGVPPLNAEAPNTNNARTQMENFIESEISSRLLLLVKGDDLHVIHVERPGTTCQNYLHRHLGGTRRN